MRPEDFDFLYRMEERYWWFRAMREITDAIAGRELQRASLKVLDAGCGTGYNLRHYSRAGHSVYGFDIASEAVYGVCKRGFTRVAQASVTEIPFRSEAFDIVFSFDVICQLPKEANDAAVREMHRVLKPGGFIFVRAPAFEWLRSSHDADLHTAHRFTLHELQNQLMKAGFKVRRSTYANTFLFPVVVVRRALKRFGVGAGTDVKPLPRSLAWLDPIFRNVLSSEAAVFRRNGRLPFGLSVICYAEKPI